MAKRIGKGLKEPEVMDYGGVLSARVVLEHDEADHSYHTFLETLTNDGKPGFQRAGYLLLREAGASGLQ